VCAAHISAAFHTVAALGLPGPQKHTLCCAAVAAPRAAKTLMIYLMETNGNVYSWLVEFYKKNPIPRVSPPASLFPMHALQQMRAPS
jgi:hypothetical protein